MRLLLRGPVPVGRLGEVLGVTRQAARKVAARLEQQGYVATTAADPADGRRVILVLTRPGAVYARAVAEVVADLNRALEARVSPGELAAAASVLRAVLDGGGARDISAPNHYDDKRLPSRPGLGGE